jgi:hypothetical protein
MLQSHKKYCTCEGFSSWRCHKDNAHDRTLPARGKSSALFDCERPSFFCSMFTTAGDRVHQAIADRAGVIRTDWRDRSPQGEATGDSSPFGQ